jgi:hypothetical protein
MNSCTCIARLFKILSEDVLHSANPLMERWFIHGCFDFFRNQSGDTILN